MATKIIPAAPGCRIRTTALVRKNGKTFEVSGFFGRTTPEIRQYLENLGYVVFQPAANEAKTTNNHKEESSNVGDCDYLYVHCNFSDGRYTGRPTRFTCATIIA